MFLPFPVPVAPAEFPVGAGIAVPVLGALLQGENLLLNEPRKPSRGILQQERALLPM